MTQTERLRAVSGEFGTHKKGNQDIRVSGGRISEYQGIRNQSKKLISDQRQAKSDKNPRKNG
jgi:hypothetical protein